MINQPFPVVEPQFICLEMKKPGRQRPINYATLHRQGVLSNQEIGSGFAPWHRQRVNTPGLSKSRTGLRYLAFAYRFDRYIHSAVHLTQCADESIHCIAFEFSIANATDVTVINPLDMLGGGAIG